MADPVWHVSSPLEAVATTGRHGASEGKAGIAMREIRSFRLFLVMARRGRAAAMRKTARALFGADPGDTPGAVAGSGGCIMIWSGPDQFYALTPVAGARQLDELKTAFAPSASVSDQSGGRALIRVAGPRVRDCLAKLLSIDLHPDVFGIGGTAATLVAHMPVNVWRDGDDAFNILVFAGYAETLWTTILDHGAEYGVDMLGPAAPG
ncbi:MAG: sarcosine oxidase subunit gamma family protein [Rhizobiaceae bacterium]